MKGTPFKRFSVSVDEETYKVIQKRAAASGESMADVTRKLIKEGLTSKVTEENTDLIAKIIRQQLEIVIKPHIERLAALSSKSGHMSATAAFLNVQALMDLVPKENRRNVLEMYENARKKAVVYMKTKADEWRIEE